MSSLEHYSKSYAEAREKFLAAAADAGLPVQSVPHPQKGPDGEELAMDFVHFGPADAERLFVLVTGIHGVEGYPGSAIQTGLIKDGIAEKLPPNVRVLFVHALNPYGFAYTRLFNEDNVDVGRNFLNYENPLPVNLSYPDVQHLVSPEDYSEGKREEVVGELFAYMGEHGMTAIEDAANFGQYSHPEGLFFGGTAPAWSNVTLRKAMNEHCAGATHVVLFDLHSGNGEYAKCQVFHDADPGSPAADRMAAWWGEKATGPDEPWDVPPEQVGPMKLVLNESCPNAEHTSLAMECGNDSPMELFFALQADNWAHRALEPSHPDYLACKKRLREAFYPDKDEWKAAIWDEARDIVYKGLTGFAAS